MDSSLFPYAILLALFCIKHYLADGHFQTEWHALKKGKYGHPAGLAHAGIHVLCSMAAIAVWYLLPITHEAVLSVKIIALILVAEFVIHYHIDWAKAFFVDTLGWQKAGKDSNGKKALHIYDTRFFQAMVADQALHMVTYVVMGTFLA